MCRARDGRSAGKNICLEKKFVCDNYLQCEDGKDEDDCEEEYVRKRVFPGNFDYRCKSPFLVTQKEANGTGEVFSPEGQKVGNSYSSSSYNFTFNSFHLRCHCCCFNPACRAQVRWSSSVPRR